jgi:hypothetical protein
MTISLRYSPSGISLVDVRGAVVKTLPRETAASVVEAELQLALSQAPGGGPPDWAAFKVRALESDPLKTILVAAEPVDPQAKAWLSVGLLRAEEGDCGDFALSWRRVVSAANVPAEVVAGFVDVARVCRLPVEFLAALQPPPV